MLKNSARNCKLKRSLNGKSLNVEKSSRWNPGPATCVGPPPKAAKPVKGIQPTGVGGVVPNTHGWVNAARFENRLNDPFESICKPLFGSCPGSNMALQAVPEAV